MGSVTGGYALLAPVCNLSPLQGLIAPGSASAKVTVGVALATAGPLGHCVRDE